MVVSGETLRVAVECSRNSPAPRRIGSADHVLDAGAQVYTVGHCMFHPLVRNPAPRTLCQKRSRRFANCGAGQAYRARSILVERGGE